jgi:N-acetylmuramoyl-L-alanine amidase
VPNRVDRRWVIGEGSPRQRRDADLFWADLVGGRPHPAEESVSPPPEWLAIARRLPLRFGVGTMTTPILGVVVHTTNHGAGAETLDRFHADWESLKNQSTHFMVDREGNIGQFRSTRQRAGHIKAPEPRWDDRYFGIEHIAKHKQPLTDIQLERSARLIGDLAVLFGFPARALPRKGDTGIGIHVDFATSGCGEGVFWSRSGATQPRTDTYARLVKRAQDFARWGF